MIAVALAVVVGSITIETNGECPSAAAIAEALAPMLSAAGARLPVQRVVVAVESGAVVLQLHDANDALTGTRRLGNGSDCNERARAAAVVIAAQQLQLRADVDLHAPPPLAGSRPPQGASAISRRARTRSRIAYDVSAAFVSSFDDGGAYAPGGSLALALGRPDGHFAGRVAFAGGGTRTVALGAGSADWTRVSLSVGAMSRLRSGRFVFDFDADAIVGLLLVDGHGYVQDQRSINVDPGLSAGVRMGVRWRQLEPFIGVSIVGWLRSEQVDAQALTAHVELPRFETLLTVGASFGTF